MSYTPVPDVTAGDFGRASWADIVKDDLADHETRIVAVEATGTGDVVGPSASIASEIPLYDGTTGKLLKRATGTGYVKVTSGVYQTPVATVPTTDLSGTIALATQVSGDLPFANLTQGSALSVLGVTGNATADNASIVAASDGQVVRRSGTSVGFGAVDFANANAITGALPLANLPTNFAQIFKATVPLTDAQIKALPTTPFALVPAPAAGLTIEPLWARLVLNATAGAYTNINAGATVTIQHAGNPWPVMSYMPNDAVITNGSATRVSDFFGSAASRRRAILVPWADTEDVDDWGPIPAIRDASGGEAQVLNLDFDNSGSGNLTGGNAANVLTVIVVYMVL